MIFHAVNAVQRESLCELPSSADAKVIFYITLISFSYDLKRERTKMKLDLSSKKNYWSGKSGGEQNTKSN